jgi:gliding motility-associated-like protein
VLSNKFFFSCILFLLFQAASIAQPQNNIWYFGDYAGLDFNGGSPVAITDGELYTNEGSASIADINGNLLFYTDGITVWNKLHQVMPNGFGLFGNPSTTQAALIVPMPDNEEQYYIFTIDELGGSMHYSIVDITLDGGLGDVTDTKNILLHPSVSEKQAAIQRCDGSVWIISHEWGSNKFFADKITELGMEASIESDVGTTHEGGSQPNYNSVGQMKISKQGNRIALCMRDLNLFEIFDFDINTGIVTNPISLISPDFNIPYGLEFSPDGTKLYGGVYSTQNIYQFNLLAGSASEILSTSVVIGSNNGYTCSIQLGPDNKVYVAWEYGYDTGAEYVGVINNPNNIGLDCNYLSEGIFLEGGLSLAGLPSLMIIPHSIELEIEITGIDSICEGQNTVLSAGGGSHYTWSSSANDTTNSITVFPSNTTDYFLISTSPNVCGTAYDTITVFVNQKPNGIIEGNQTICKGDTLQLIAEGGITYQWINSSIDTSASISVSPLVNTQYSVSVSNEICSDTASIEVLVREVVPAHFDFFTDNCSSQTIFKNLSPEAISFNWNFGNGDFSFAENPVEILPDGNYDITFTTNPETNCADTLQETITIDNPKIEVLYIPNSFSPNGDGLNDLFAAKGEGIKDFHLLIFSRWGELIFESYDINNKWNGIYKTSFLVQTESYIYSVIYSTICNETNKIEKRGTIELIR